METAPVPAWLERLPDILLDTDEDGLTNGQGKKKKREKRFRVAAGKSGWETSNLVVLHKAVIMEDDRNHFCSLLNFGRNLARIRIFNAFL